MVAMVAIAQWADVVTGGGSAGGVVEGVVLVGLPGGSAATREAAGAVADLHVSGECVAGEAVAGDSVKHGEAPSAIRVLGGEVADHSGPGPTCGGIGGQARQIRGGDVQFDYAAATQALLPRRYRRAQAGGAGQHEGTIGVGDGESPLCAVVLSGHQSTGHAG
jgi:hypothetical protein